MSYQLSKTGEQIDEILAKGDTLLGTTDPTSATTGVIGQFYINSATNKLFACIATSPMTWASVGGGGGGGEILSLPVPTTGWTKNDTANWYTQTLSLQGITSDDVAKVDINTSSYTTGEDVESALASWANMFRFVSGANQLTIYTSQVPTIALTLTVEV